MPSLLVFSDFHAHNFKFGAKRVTHPHLQGWYNSRLMDCVNVLKEMRAYATRNEIHAALFGGDLFHRRSVVHTDVYNAIQDELERWFPIQLYMIPGNHDYADRKGKIHALTSLAKFPHIHVIDKVTSRTITEKSGRSLINVYTVPYTDDPEEARAALTAAGEVATVSYDNGLPKLLLAHLGMQGATVGSDYVLESQSDVTKKDVPHEKFDLCLFGHYHQHQQLFDNGWFIGATHHHNWGDANTKRGFLHVSWDKPGDIRFKQVETKTAPRFIKISDKTMETAPKPRKQDFVKLITSPKMKLRAEDIDGAMIETVEADLSEESNIEINEDQLDPISAISAWVDMTADGDQVLKDLGLRFIRKAMEDDI